MRRVYLISLIGLLYLIVTSLYFIFKPSQTSISSTFYSSKSSKNTVSDEENDKIIMGFMGNRTEK
jgi:hypothetical protein